MSLFLPILFLVGSLLLTICNTALAHLGKFKSKEPFKYMFPKQKWENLYFSVSLGRQIYPLAFMASSIFLFLPSNATRLPGIILSLIALYIFLDFLMQIFASLWSRQLSKIVAPISSLYLLPLFPITSLFAKLNQTLIHKVPHEEENHLPDKHRLREMIRESELQHHLEPVDQNLISSFINFKERVAKEIMVPRVDLFSLSSNTSIQEAARLFSQEGYSRIPIYKDTLDQIVGVVLYKDLLKCFTSEKNNLSSPLETIAKPVLYAPENKKVSLLLQEFRNKQIHMAIIVDEYGGTEGIVTIEDILEELVGEIEDEYDVDEEHPFWEIPGGGWIIDAKMTLLDIADQIGIHLPTHPEYETLGGYVYHCAGTIPSKGWRISHDKFDLEVVSSNERAIKKIKVQPRIEPAS